MPQVAEFRLFAKLGDASAVAADSAGDAELATCGVERSSARVQGAKPHVPAKGLDLQPVEDVKAGSNVATRLPHKTLAVGEVKRPRQLETEVHFVLFVGDERRACGRLTVRRANEVSTDLFLRLCVRERLAGTLVSLLIDFIVFGFRFDFVFFEELVVALRRRR